LYGKLEGAAKHIWRLPEDTAFYKGALLIKDVLARLQQVETGHGRLK